MAVVPRRSARKALALPWIGWATISRDELAQAQGLMEPELRGMRDPLGLNAIHSLYADRFFPGTSTQMTGLRYVLLVAAAYEKLRRKDIPIEAGLPRYERDTALQLLAGLPKGASPRGIIGHTIAHARAPQILPSMSYWTALSQWGLVGVDRVKNKRPSRSAIHSDWQAFRRRQQRPGDEFEGHRSLFDEELEEKWRAGVSGASLSRVGDRKYPLSLEVEPHERDLLRTYLTAPFGAGRSYLGALAAHSGATRPWRMPVPWHPRLRSLIPPGDREALVDAMRLAHLGLAARAIYDVLVARILRKRDGVNVDDRPEERLEQITASNGVERKLALAAPLAGDAAKVVPIVTPRTLHGFLRGLRDWLESPTDPEKLRPLFAGRELGLKIDPRRTRLHPVQGQEQRGDWLRNYQPAQPLNYRWPIVQRLLSDLAGEPQ